MIEVHCQDAEQTPQVEFSKHAVQRYQLRGRPGLEYETALDELESMRILGDLTSEPPPWLADTRRDADSYLVLADLAFPLIRCGKSLTRLTAVTCIVRGGITPWERERRNRRRPRRSHRREHRYRLAAKQA